MFRRRVVLRTVIAIVCLVVASSAAASPGPVTSVVGGEPASISTFPFMARITAHESGFEYTCSGTVVSSNMVLTAAHCLLNEAKTAFLPIASIEVLTGTSSLSVPGVVSYAERVVIDPNYKSSGTLAGWHDVGLIQLAAPITAPAVRLASSQIWSPGTRGYTVGWGLTEGEGELPTEMQVGTTVVQSQAYCEQEIGAHFHPLAELCSIDYPSYETAVCHGDSGGPMLQVVSGELVEIGIASFSVGEACPTDTPRVHARADTEVDWVDNEIEAHPPRTTTTTTPSSTAPSSTSAAPTAAPTTTPQLPTLSSLQAKHDLFYALHHGGRLASAFLVHRAYHAGCHSTGSTSAQCSVRWLGGIFRYEGIVQISEKWEDSTPVWVDHYWIQMTNELCRSKSSHPSRCRNQLLHA